MVKIEIKIISDLSFILFSVITLNTRIFVGHTMVNKKKEKEQNKRINYHLGHIHQVFMLTIYFKNVFLSVPISSNAVSKMDRSNIVLNE